MRTHEIWRHPTFIEPADTKENTFLNPHLKTMRGFRQGFVLGGHSNKLLRSLRVEKFTP
jgi:hypothetical protein